MFEIAFSIDVDALSSEILDVAEAESAYLRAFDAASAYILEVARTAYKRTKRHSYAFTAADVGKR